jgi:Tetratricopeptide repeat
MRRSLAIAEKERGPEHPIVGTALNQLAGVLRAQRRYGEAEALYRRSIAISEKALGQEHPTVGNVLNGLAELYRDLAVARAAKNRAVKGGSDNPFSNPMLVAKLGPQPRTCGVR